MASCTNIYGNEVKLLDGEGNPVKSTNGSISVANIDTAGNEQINGVFGEAFTDRVDDVSVQFQYNYFDEQFDVNPEVVTGDGTTTVANELATVSSAVTGTALRSSRDTIQYNAGRTGYGFFTAKFEGTGKGRAGPFDMLNGFPLDVTNGIASFGYIKSGADKGSAGVNGFDNQDVWNGSLNISEVDLTKVNVFLVTYGYLGVANAVLWIKLDKWHTLHTIKTEGRLPDTHVNTPVFPISIYAENGSSVSSGSWAGGVIGGRSEAASRGFMFPNTIVTGTNEIVQGQAVIPANTTKSIVIFHSKEIYQGKTNYAKAILTGYDFSTDIPSGNQLGTVIYQIVAVQTLTGTPTYTDINALSSVIEYDHDDVTGTGASVEVLTGTPIVTRNLEYIGQNKGGAIADATVDAEAIGAFAYAGSTFAVIGKNIGSTDVIARAILNWDELF